MQVLERRCSSSQSGGSDDEVNGNGSEVPHGRSKSTGTVYFSCCIGQPAVCIASPALEAKSLRCRLPRKISPWQSCGRVFLASCSLQAACRSRQAPLRRTAAMAPAARHRSLPQRPLATPRWALHHLQRCIHQIHLGLSCTSLRHLLTTQIRGSCAWVQVRLSNGVAGGIIPELFRPEDLLGSSITTSAQVPAPACLQHVSRD